MRIFFLLLIFAPFAHAEDFWSYWGDGKAELASYDIEINRYGERRSGTAVAITVTEDFSNSLRVKADPGKHPPSDVFPVLKLNLIQDFPTGIYDYNLMTSVFISLKDRPLVSKLSFSGQEWCGHVYSQLLFDPKKIRLNSHSYFDGEADQIAELENINDGLSEDALLLWARGFAEPILKPGETRTVDLLDSLKFSRLNHRELKWRKAKLSRKSPERLEVEIPNIRTWTIDVEAAYPHRVRSWTTSDGYTGKLISSTRLPYWQLNSNRSINALKELGLKTRATRTP